MSPNPRASSDEEMVRHEEELAAREAGAIGGRADEGDPAMKAVNEAGGGESEGFEQSEAALIENASHGNERSTTEVFGLQGKPEDDRANAPCGEADHEKSSERRDS